MSCACRWTRLKAFSLKTSNDRARYETTAAHPKSHPAEGSGSGVHLLFPAAFCACATSVNTRIGDQRYDRCMSSDLPPGAFPADRGQHWGPPPQAGSAPVQTPPVAPTAFGRLARWPAFTALAIALVALAVGLVGWFRPAPHTNPPPSNPTYTAQQTADAKAKVCGAVEKFNRAVSVNNALPRGNDPIVAAVNSRQIFDVFSRHLLATLAEEPATPADLATAVRELASTLEEAVIEYEDGLSNSDPEMRPNLDASSTAADTIQRLCK
jgi:hypothetical protein